MMQFNLLPHRLQRCRRQRQQFYAVLMMSCLLGGGLSGIGWHALIEQQAVAQASIRKLQTASRTLATAIKAGAALQAQTTAMQADSEHIETMSRQRDRTTVLLRLLGDQMPQGATLQRLRQQGEKITLDGDAGTNRDVSALLQNLNAQTDLVASALLLETHATDAGARPLSFSIALALKPIL